MGLLHISCGSLGASVQHRHQHISHMLTTKALRTTDHCQPVKDRLHIVSPPATLLLLLNRFLVAYSERPHRSIIVPSLCGPAILATIRSNQSSLQSTSATDRCKPCSLSSMASSPSEQWSKGLRKITAVNRFAQSEAAGIKPGEDASDLIDRTSYRRQDTASTPVGNHHASRLYQDGLSERLKGLRNGLLSGQESKSSDSTCSEQSSGNSSSVRPVSHARRAADHRVFPYSKHDPTRPSNHRRLSSLSAVSETEPPFYSQFWAESPSIPPLSDFGGSMSAADSNAPSLTSRTTASTCDSLSEPVGVSRVLERQHP